MCANDLDQQARKDIRRIVADGIVDANENVTRRAYADAALPNRLPQLAGT